MSENDESKSVTTPEESVPTTSEAGSGTTRRRNIGRNTSEAPAGNSGTDDAKPEAGDPSLQDTPPEGDKPPEQPTDGDTDGDDATAEEGEEKSPLRQKVEEVLVGLDAKRSAAHRRGDGPHASGLTEGYDAATEILRYVDAEGL